MMEKRKPKVRAQHCPCGCGFAFYASRAHVEARMTRHLRGCSKAKGQKR